MANVSGSLSESQHGALAGPASAHDLEDLDGTISDAQHGARTTANAHAHGNLSGVTADQHHTESHEARHRSGGADALSHANIGGVTASQHHQRTEAKVTAGSALSESVTWTTAFASTPIVTTSTQDSGGGNNSVYIASRSTTGATLTNVASPATFKSAIAQEAT